MPLVDIERTEGVFDKEQKQEMIRRVTDAMVAVEGEAMRGVTWVRVREVASGEWAIGGQPVDHRRREGAAAEVSRHRDGPARANSARATLVSSRIEPAALSKQLAAPTLAPAVAEFAESAMAYRPNALAAVTLDDKYTLDRGRIYLTGTQALVRLPLLQRQRDVAAGLNTGCFISGYRGSPLGGFDQALWSARRFVERNHFKFQPAINEEWPRPRYRAASRSGCFPAPNMTGFSRSGTARGRGWTAAATR